MSPCLLTDSLPGSALGLPVRTDFRGMVWFENELVRLDETDKDALRIFMARALRGLMGPQALQDPQRAWEALLWFYRCGKEPDPEQQAAHPGTPQSRAYDYAVDAPLIAAAFRQAYGIDLTDPALEMHWWLFHALFEGLPADCTLHRIMEYRVADTSDMPDRTRQFYERMRERYALPGQIGGVPHYASLEEREAAFLARLPGGT